MGSLFSAPAPPGPLPDPPHPPNLFDPRIAAMRRQRLEELKRKKGRQATILTAGLGARTETAPSPGNARFSPSAPRPGTTLLTAGLETRTEGKPVPTPDQPQQPETPRPDQCERILEELKQVIKELFAVRAEIRETAGEIVSKEEEIKRLKSAPIDLPPIPLRLPRSPIKLRREIPSAAVDIEQGRRALTSLDKRIKINNLEEKIRVLKQELKNLRGKEGQKERNERDLVNKYQECKAENLRP